MRYFDLHCDTMTECAVKDIPLRENRLHVDLETVAGWEHYVQCYAVWLPDNLRGESAWERFLQVAGRFSEEIKKNYDSLSHCVIREIWHDWKRKATTAPYSLWRVGQLWAENWSTFRTFSAWEFACAP